MQRGEIYNPEYSSNNNEKLFKYQQSLIKMFKNLKHGGKNKTTPSQIHGEEKRPNATALNLREKKGLIQNPSDAPNRR